MRNPIVLVLVVALTGSGCDRGTPTSVGAPAGSSTAGVAQGPDPQTVLRKVDALAERVVTRLSGNESSARKSETSRLKTEAKYTLRSTDVRKSDSLIDPVVGVIKIERSVTIEGGGYIRQFITIVAAPRAGDKWKCLSAENVTDAASTGGADGVAHDWFEGTSKVVNE